jgi:hypothetical protein
MDQHIHRLNKLIKMGDKTFLILTKTNGVLFHFLRIPTRKYLLDGKLISLRGG